MVMPAELLPMDEAYIRSGSWPEGLQAAATMLWGTTMVPPLDGSDSLMFFRLLHRQAFAWLLMPMLGRAWHWLRQTQKRWMR
jgi:hypothetical protein